MDLHQQQFRIPKNSGQGIVQLVTQHFAKILFYFRERLARAFRLSLCLLQAAANQAKRRRHASTVARHVISGARIDQRRKLPAPLRSPDHDDRRVHRQRSHHGVKPRHDPSPPVGLGRDRCLFKQNHCRRIILEDSPRRGNTRHRRHAEPRDIGLELPARRRAQRRIVAHHQYGLFPVAHGFIHFSLEFFWPPAQAALAGALWFPAHRELFPSALPHGTVWRRAEAYCALETPACARR